MKEILYSTLNITAPNRKVLSLAIDFVQYCDHLDMEQYPRAVRSILQGQIRYNSTISSNSFDCGAVDCIPGRWSNWKREAGCECSRTMNVTCIETRVRNVSALQNRIGKPCDHLQEWREISLSACPHGAGVMNFPTVFSYRIDPSYNRSKGGKLRCELMTEFIGTSISWNLNAPSYRHDWVLTVFAKVWEIQFRGPPLDRLFNRSRIPLGMRSLRCSGRY